MGALSSAWRGTIAIGTIALSLITLPIKSVGQPRQPDVTMSICDVLANDPTILNGKLIKVRGILSGTDEGTWLSGECKTYLETKGLAWGNSISIWQNETNKNSLRSWHRMGKKLNQLHADWAQDRIWVTFVGWLTTRPTMNDAIVQMPYGLNRAGFGHLGGSPAEIEVLSVADVRVERRPANVSRE